MLFHLEVRVLVSRQDTFASLDSRGTDERSRGCQNMLLSFQSVMWVVLKHQFW